jgi:hypothetical protein
MAMHRLDFGENTGSTAKIYTLKEGACAMCIFQPVKDKSMGHTD